MSQENVELARRIHEAWDRNEPVRDFFAENMEYVNPSYAVEPGTRIGRTAFGSVRETYPDFTFHVVSFIDAGDEDVVVLGRYTGSGGVSGIRVEGDHGYVWTFRDGLAVRFQWFQSHREALEAAGVEPAST